MDEEQKRQGCQYESLSDRKGGRKRNMREKKKKRETCVKFQKDEMICSSECCIEVEGNEGERPFISRKHSLSIPSGKVSTLWLVRRDWKLWRQIDWLFRGLPKINGSSVLLSETCLLKCLVTKGHVLYVLPLGNCSNECRSRFDM